VNEKIERGVVACKTGTAEFGGVDERGYRKTHAWTTAIVGIPLNKITGQLEAKMEEASGSADLTIGLGSMESQTATNSAVLDKESWKKLVEEHGFPEKIIITVLVESDSNKIYSEGSQDAAPVIAQILKGMLN
jgi:cell division protein FtsI/penicillin-binding protein 2